MLRHFDRQQIRQWKIDSICQNFPINESTAACNENPCLVRFFLLVAFSFSFVMVGDLVSLFLFHLSWLVTLFPIMGIVRVGMFVADQIVVTSSVSVCILVAHFLCLLVDNDDSGDLSSLSRKKRKRQHRHSSSTSFPFCSILPNNKWRCILVVVVKALSLSTTVSKSPSWKTFLVVVLFSFVVHK